MPEVRIEKLKILIKCELKGTKNKQMQVYM